jgi:hypothetical protein
LTIHERAVRGPEVFDDHLAVDDADKAVEARDAVVREDDVETWISSRNHDTFKEPDPSSRLAAVHHHERPRLVGGRHPSSSDCREDFGPHATARSIVMPLIGHLTKA